MLKIYYSMKLETKFLFLHNFNVDCKIEQLVKSPSMGAIYKCMR